MKKVLIAEDDAFISDIAQAKLIQAGYEVFKVEKGDQVFKELMQVKPDMLLLDLMLPYKHGFQVLEEIREAETFVDLPVIIFSNETGPLVEEKARKLNATYFLRQ